MTYTITEPAPANIAVTEAAEVALTISQPVPTAKVLAYEGSIASHLAALDPHPQYSKPINPVFAYSATTGLLLSVTYGDGSTKVFNWTGQQLTSFDYTRNGTTTRYSFVYLDGIVQSISQEVI